MTNFILTDRKTDYLLPPSVDEWLTDDHLARFVVEVIDGLDLSSLTRQYAGRGSKAHHPATLLAILVYPRLSISRETAIVSPSGGPRINPDF